MKTDLNFGWRFLAGRYEDGIDHLLKEGERVDIPHCVKLFPIQYINERDYQGEYTYQLVFDAKDERPVKILRFDGVMLQCDVYLNGVKLGHFISGFLPFEVEVSEIIRPKNNLLTVFVDGREDPDIPPFGKVVDYLTYAGIYREVSLLCEEEAYIEDLYVEASADGNMILHPTFIGKAEAYYELKDGENVLATFKTPRHKAGRIVPWSIDNPKLYTLEAHYGDSVRSVRFGFRDISFRKEGFFLNGKRVPIIGLNRHQTFPYFGPAAPKGLQEEDADLLKASGINLVRTSHYPQSEHFLNRCDEIGLLVVDEIPGWQFIGTSENWRGNCVDFARRMILKERQHACLVAYGLRIDESGDDDDLYQKVQDVKAKLDPHRPSLGVRNFKDSHCLEDIYAYNDFSCAGLDHGCDPSSQLKGGEGKPLLISESNGHMFPTKPFDPTIRRAEHALRHARVLSDVLSDPGYCGAITWCAFDYATHNDFGSGDHICHHGVYDIFRNPKYAAKFFQSQGEVPTLEVASLLQPGDYDEALLPKFYVFTNADSVKLYRGDSYIAEFHPDKKAFPALAHPPILIDDIIGAMFNEPKISKKDGEKIVGMFNYCAQNGYSRLKIGYKLFMARMMAKYHLNFTYVYNTFAKYVQSWGQSSSLWRFEAYKDGKKIQTVVRGPSNDFHLDLQCQREVLVNGETYDAVRVGVLKKDQFGTTMPYASDPIRAEVEGPIEIYGPKLFSLYGGGSAVYVRSLPVKGPTEAVLRLYLGEETYEQRFIVK